MIDNEDEKEDDLQSHSPDIPWSVSSEYVPEARSLLKMKKNNQKNKKRSLKTSQSSDFASILHPPDIENGSISLAMWPVCFQMWQRRFSYSYFISASLLFVCMCAIGVCNFAFFDVTWKSASLSADQSQLDAKPYSSSYSRLVPSFKALGLSFLANATQNRFPYFRPSATATVITGSEVPQPWRL